MMTLHISGEACARFKFCQLSLIKRFQVNSLRSQMLDLVEITVGLALIATGIYLYQPAYLGGYFLLIGSLLVVISSYDLITS